MLVNYKGATHQGRLLLLLDHKKEVCEIYRINLLNTRIAWYNKGVVKNNKKTEVDENV